MEKQVEWCWGIPFVDDVTWLAERANLNEESFPVRVYISFVFPLFFPLFYFFGERGMEPENPWEGSCWGFLGGRSLRFIGGALARVLL